MSGSYITEQHVDDMNEEIGMADHNDASQDWWLKMFQMNLLKLNKMIKRTKSYNGHTMNMHSENYVGTSGGIAVNCHSMMKEDSFFHHYFLFTFSCLFLFSCQCFSYNVDRTKLLAAPPKNIVDPIADPGHHFQTTASAVLQLMQCYKWWASVPMAVRLC